MFGNEFVYARGTLPVVDNYPLISALYPCTCMCVPVRSCPDCKVPEHSSVVLDVSGTVEDAGSDILGSTPFLRISLE